MLWGENNEQTVSGREQEMENQKLTWISAYEANGKLPSWVFSSSAASRGIDFWLPSFNVSLCDNGGMPVTGSSFAFSCPMVHEGVIRRSDEEFSEVI